MLVSYTSGITVHIGDPSNNEYYRSYVEIKDIDPDLDVDEQIQKAHVAFHKLAQWAEEQIAEKMEAEWLKP